jgi:sterol desaturase/sphingolipid hydroxylase (fatty acid hydroxylase superfamily)
MPVWIPDEVRLSLLVIGCGLLWVVESVRPLYRDRPHRWRHALPNLGLTVILILTNIVLSFSSAAGASYAEHHHVGLLFLVPAPMWITVIVGIAGLDLFTYLAHVLLHKSPMAWHFHRVHHCDREVDVTTAFRQHPGETVWRILWQVAAIVVFGIPLWVVVLYLTLSSLNAQLEHANITLNARVDWLLRWFIVTPDMHKAHHSRYQPETDSNYANIFSLWDRLFGTYTARINFRELRYGLEGDDRHEHYTLAGLLRLPFVTG